MFKILKELSKYSKFLRKGTNARSLHTTREHHVDNLKKTLCFASSNQILFQQLRPAHTDIRCPDFDKHRRKSLSCPDVKTYESEESRKAFSYMVLGMACSAGLYGVKVEVVRYIKFMAASKDVLALAKIEINLNDIPEGKSATFKWRGKPLFIRHRSQAQIDGARKVPIETLRDPATDESRCPNPKWLIVLGVCTHLGCVPMADLGDFGPGGYYCPCHGAHYDAAGRCRKGPAPLNLAIPEHKFVGENNLIVG